MTRFAPGTRVSLKPLSSIVAALHGAVGTVREAEILPAEGLQWMQFDEPIAHYAHGQMTGCWFDPSWVEVLVVWPTQEQVTEAVLEAAAAKEFTPDWAKEQK